MAIAKSVGFKTKVGYSKGRAGRTYTKRKQALTKTEKVEVKKIAKRVLSANVEHKYNMQSTVEFVARCQDIYALNPMGTLTLGTDSGSRIGEAINNVTLRVKMSYVHLGTKVSIPNSKLWPRSQLRVMVVRTKRQLTNTNIVFTDITSTVGKTDSALARDNCLFYQPNGWSNPFHVAIQDIRKDNDYRVIYDNVLTSDLTHGYTDVVSGNFIPNGKFVNSKFTVKLGKFEYEESNAAYARKGLDNVYIIVSPYIPKSLAGIDQAGDVVCHYSLSYTDS